MSTMPSSTTGLPFGRPLTRADLVEMPDDGHRYELVDGSLIVSPSPAWMHQRAVGRLYRLLDDAVPTDEFEVLTGPFDVVLADDTVLIPDVLVFRCTDATPKALEAAPLLAVEVLSPSTRRVDLMLKWSRYEAAGCSAYWVVDPDGPRLTAWQLRDGRYVETGSVTGDQPFHAEHPYPIDVTPSALFGRPR